MIVGFCVAGYALFPAFEDCCVELVFWYGKPVWRGDQLPGVGYGFFFEIIAEGKIAEHFEEGVVAVGEADIFEIVVLAAGADAFLAGGGAVVIALFEAEEDILNWFIPALVKRSVGSLAGTSEELRTRRWPFSSKNFRNVSRISLPVTCASEVVG